MAYRIFDVKIAKVEASRLVIKRKRVKENKVKYLKTAFVVNNQTLITDKDNHTVTLLDIKVGSRVTIDFIKTQDRKLLAKGINALRSVYK